MSVIRNETSNTLITGTADDDTIYNGNSPENTLGQNVTIDALGGNDYIENRKGNVSIHAGAGDDTVVGGFESVTINGGLGNDYIQSWHYQYEGGNDTIWSGYLIDCYMIQLMNGTLDDHSVDGSDIVLKVGDGSVRVRDSNDVSIGVRDSDNKLRWEIYSDTCVYYPNATSLISGTDGDDTIINTEIEATIDAGAGNDSVRNGIKNVTILSGKGDDTIELVDNSKTLIKYTEGDGNDLILSNFDIIPGISQKDGIYDTLKVSDATINAVTIGAGEEGIDIVLGVGEDQITLRPTNQWHYTYVYQNEYPIYELRFYNGNGSDVYHLYGLGDYGPEFNVNSFLRSTAATATILSLPAARASH